MDKAGSLTTLALALLLEACAGGGTGSSGDGPSISPEAKSLPAAVTITGRLGVDSVEGGCPYLEAEDGTRYEMVYPVGWQADQRTGALRNPDGEVVASVGNEITVRGELATDMASICQIGPIFRAAEVITQQE